MLGTLSKDHNENTMPTRVKMIPFCKDPYPKKIHFIWVAMYKRTNWGLYFYISNLNRDRHFRWSSKPCEGLAICSEKGVPSFLRYFKTVLSIGAAAEIDLATSRSAVERFTKGGVEDPR